MKNDATVENQNNISDEDRYVSDDSQEISEQEMTNLSGENSDDNIIVDKQLKPSFKQCLYMFLISVHKIARQSSLS